MTFSFIKKQNSGFSLVEVLISVVIVSLAVIALAKIIFINYEVNHVTLQTREAGELISNKMTELKAIDSQTEIQAGVWSYEDIISGSENVTDTYGTYTLSWTVTENATPVTYKTIDISATWTDSDNVTHTETLSSFIREHDPGLQAKSFQ